MLNLDVLVRRLTQGRAPAEMTPVALPPAGAAPGGSPDGEPPAAPGGADAGGPAEIDVQALAQRVYALFCQEAAERNRRLGGRR